MTIVLEFINFIVPRRVIEQKYPGGWDACIRDHEPLIGGRVWYDAHLFRDGAMSPAAMGSIVDEWLRLGFDTRVTTADGERWKDVCVVEVMFGGPTLPCDWIEVDCENRTASLAGARKSPVVGRDNVGNVSL